MGDEVWSSSMRGVGKWYAEEALEGVASQSHNHMSNKCAVGKSVESSTRCITTAKAQIN